MSGHRQILVAAGLTVLAVAALGVVAYLVADRYCPAHTGYFGVRVGPGAEYYFRVHGSEMRMARSHEQLRVATPVRAVSAGDSAIAWASDAQLTPNRGSVDWEKVQVNILATEPFPKRRAVEKPAVLVDLGLPTEDREGHRWVYWVRAELPVQGDPKAMPWVRVPRRHQASLALVPYEVPLHRVGFALNMDLGGLKVVGITRDGQVTHAQLALYSDNGRLIDSASGPVSDFGTVGDFPLYSVSVRRNHRYTMKASVDAGPLGKLNATSAYVLPPRTTRNQGYCPSLPCTPE